MRGTCATYANRGGTYYIYKIHNVKLFVPVCHQEAQNTFLSCHTHITTIKMCVFIPLCPSGKPE